MLAKKYKSELISIQNPLKCVFKLEFKSLGRVYKYEPGQFLHLAIDQDYDGIGQWPESRCFSMQSNPNEETLKITYVIKGNYTHQMANKLKVGSEVWLKLPYGDLFSQTHNKINTVFIAGGTGITPYLSLFTHDSFKEYLNPKIYLGFRSKEFNIYDSELASLKNTFKQITIFYEDTDGQIDINRIAAENGNKSDYFISGPPSMIKAFKQTLFEKRIAECSVLTDDWE